MFQVRQWDGQPISEPGIYAGVPLLKYHSAGICDGPSISSSGLRTIFGKSLAHYWATSPYNDDREDPEDDEKPSLVLGRAAHHLFLGQPEFLKEFAIRPAKISDAGVEGVGEPWQGNRTACRKWMAAKAAAGMTVIPPDTATRLLRMVKVLNAEPLIDAGIVSGKIEHSMFWRDPKTGVWLKARPDAIPTDALDFSDYKTTRDVSERAVMRAIADYSYHMQGALIGLGVKALLGEKMNSFNLVFQESTAPYSVRIIAMKDKDIETGEAECLLALRAFARSMKSGVWPGPAGLQRDVQQLGLSQYAIDDRAYRSKQLEREISE